MDRVGGVEVANPFLGRWYGMVVDVDASIHTFEYREYGIAQSAYVAQGFSPVTFITGTDGAMGTVGKKERIDSLHGNFGHMTTSPDGLSDSFIFLLIVVLSSLALGPVGRCRASPKCNEGPPRMR